MGPTEEQTYRSFLEKRLDNQDVSLGEILKQTKITNGRVSKLERWQSYVLGGCAVAVIVMLPLIYLLVQFWLEKHV